MTEPGLHQCHVGAFVPVYRCGAVPEVRRIPFSDAGVIRITKRLTDYIVSPIAGQHLYVVVSVEITTSFVTCLESVFSLFIRH